MKRQEQETLQQKTPSRGTVEGRMDCVQNKKSPRRPWKRMQKTAACGEATLELLQTFLSDYEPCKDIRFLFAGSSPSVESGRGLILLPPMLWCSPRPRKTHFCLSKEPEQYRTSGELVVPKPHKVSQCCPEQVSKWQRRCKICF